MALLSFCTTLPHLPPLEQSSDDALGTTSTSWREALWNRLRLSEFVRMSRVFSVLDIYRLLSDIWAICQKCRFELRKGCQGIRAAVKVYLVKLKQFSSMLGKFLNNPVNIFSFLWTILRLLFFGPVLRRQGLFLVPFLLRVGSPF